MKVRGSSLAEPFPYGAVTIGLVIGLLSILPYFGLFFEYVPGDVWDNRLSNYLLEHGYKWITGQTSASFFDAPFFFPARASMRYSENFLGSLPYYVPWRLLGFDRESSFQIWIVLGYMLNYLAAAWVLKKLRFHWFAVVAGAYVFAFSQVVLTHSWHIQLQYRFAIPLAWYFLHRFLEHFQSKDLAASLSFLAWQLYCNIYEGYFLVLFLAAFVLVELCTQPIIRTYGRTATVRSVSSQLLIVLGFVIAVGMLARNYASTAGDSQLMAARQSEVVTMLPRPVSYFVSRTGSSETGWFYENVDLPLKYEHIMFVGFIPWIAVLALLITRKRVGINPEVIRAIVAMLLVMGLTLYWNGYSFYFLLMKVPGVNGIRAMTRIIMILVLPFAMATAQVLHLCRERLWHARPAFASGFVIVMAASLIVENHTAPYRYSKQESHDRVQIIAAQLPSQLPPKAVLAYLYTVGDAQKYDSDVYEIDAMLAAQTRNISTMNGYSGAVPEGFRHLQSCADIRIALNDIVRQNESFSVQQPASQIVTVGAPIDGPCEPYLTYQASEAAEPLPDDAFRARIDVAAPPVVTMNAGLTAKLRITNQSSVRWPVKGLPSGQFRLKMSCQWLPSGSQIALMEYPNRFELPYDLQPNESAVIAAELSAPARPGDYTIECDAIQEMVHWFHVMGSDTGKALVQVRRDPSTPAIEGTLDLVDAHQIAGWARDQNHPDSAVQIELRDGDNHLAATVADLFRKDLLDAGIGNGAHGFSIVNPVPADGKTHMIHAFASGTNIELNGSPKPFPPR